jgi:hypothetical protein
MDCDSEHIGAAYCRSSFVSSNKGRMHRNLREASVLLTRRVAGKAVRFLALAIAIIGTSGLNTDAAEERSTPKSSTGSVLLDRIFVNWKARQDRIRFFHLSWTTNTAVRSSALGGKGGDDKLIERPMWKNYVARSELWVGPNHQFYYQRPLDYGAPLCLRTISDGQSKSTCFMESSMCVYLNSFDRESPIPRDAHMDEGLTGIEIAPLLLFCRAFDPQNSGSRAARWRLATEHAIMDGVHYVRIEHSDPKTLAVDACWVDPTREDIVVRWERSSHGRRLAVVTIEYERRSNHLSLPIRWVIEPNDHGMFSATCATVTACTLNETPPPDTFSQRPPWGSVTFEGDNALPYFMRRDRSRRYLTREELARKIVLPELGLSFSTLKKEDETSVPRRQREP